ncbi:MAG TPA: SRPBCC family protein [Gaiellaceae bacterium]
MLKLHKQIVVKAPVDRVFGYIEKPENLPQIWPSLYEVSEVEKISNGGHRFAWLYNMIGTPVKGTVETFKYESPKLIVDKASGDVDGTFKWTFASENGTTEVTFDAEYEQKGFLPEKDLTFFQRRNEVEADAILTNLKARFEV